jgi:hypothetical protein
MCLHTGLDPPPFTHTHTHAHSPLRACRYGLRRLVTLCELRITKIVDRAVTHSIERSNLDVIGLLNFASAREATQLEAWCLHFIASNHGPMRRRPEWTSLSPRHLAHVTTHQWPPLSYLAAVDRYEEERERWSKARGQAAEGRAARRWALW